MADMPKRVVPFGRIVRMSFWNAYDHVGRLILFNLLWGLMGLPWVLIFGLILLLGWDMLQMGYVLVGLCVMLGGVQVLFISPPTAALFAACRSCVAHPSVRVRTILSLVYRYGVRSQVLGLVTVAGTTMLCVNLLFYFRIGGLLGLTLGGMVGWGLLFWTLVSLLTIPVLIFWETGWMAVLRRSALIVLAHPLLSSLLLFSTGILLVLGLLTGVGLVLVAMSLTAVFLNTAFQELVQGYTHTEQDAGGGESEQEKRSWRDFLRPWEM